MTPTQAETWRGLLRGLIQGLASTPALWWTIPIVAVWIRAIWVTGWAESSMGRYLTGDDGEAFGPLHFTRSTWRRLGVGAFDVDPEGQGRVAVAYVADAIRTDRRWAWWLFRPLRARTAWRSLWVQGPTVRPSPGYWDGRISMQRWSAPPRSFYVALVAPLSFVVLLPLVVLKAVKR